MYMDLFIICAIEIDMFLLMPRVYDVSGMFDLSQDFAKG